MAFFRNAVVRCRHCALRDGGPLAVGHDLAGKHIRIGHWIHFGYLHLSFRFFPDREKEYQPHFPAAEQSLFICISSVAKLCAHSGDDDPGLHSPAFFIASGFLEHHIYDYRYGTDL